MEDKKAREEGAPVQNVEDRVDNTGFLNAVPIEETAIQEDGAEPDAQTPPVSYGGKDVIIESIRQNAQVAADSIISGAKEEQASSLAASQQDLEKKSARQIKKAEEEAAQSVVRSLMLAKLDSNKVILGAKQSVINSVYDLALQKLANMTDGIYREFIASYIHEHAEDNDVLVIGKNDVKRLHHDWLNEVSQKKKINLSFAEDFHNDAGGIILRGKDYDKNFTFSALIKEARGQTESRVVQNLFGK